MRLVYKAAVSVCKTHNCSWKYKTRWAGETGWSLWGDYWSLVINRWFELGKWWIISTQNKITTKRALSPPRVHSTPKPTVQASRKMVVDLHRIDQQLTKKCSIDSISDALSFTIERSVNEKVWWTIGRLKSSENSRETGKSEQRSALKDSENTDTVRFFDI